MAHLCEQLLTFIPVGFDLGEDMSQAGNTRTIPLAHIIDGDAVTLAAFPTGDAERYHAAAQQAVQGRTQNGPYQLVTSSNKETLHFGLLLLYYRRPSGTIPDSSLTSESTICTSIHWQPVPGLRSLSSQQMPSIV